MRRYLLDTNHATPLMDDAPALLDRYLRVGGEFLLCSPVLGELWYGVEAGSRTSQNTVKLERMLRGFEVLPFDADAAREFGRLRHVLVPRGRDVPKIDLQIMAVASVHDLVVLTADAHFANVPGITTDN